MATPGHADLAKADPRLASERIYLDYHATTPIDPRVVAVVVHYMTAAFGNASSTDHNFGDEADEAVESARAKVAALVGAVPSQVIFTSGATESINIALKGLASRFAARGKALRIAHTPVEHRAVLDTCVAIAAKGTAVLRPLVVDQAGRLDLNDLNTACRAGIDVVCVMGANNEIGTIYPIAEIARIAKYYGALVLCDATQTAGKIPISFGDWGLDLLALSAHKLYGPKGAGALVLERKNLLEPVIHGGGHESGLRSGTLNVPAIAGLGEACRYRIEEMSGDEPRIAALRNRMQETLLDGFPDLTVNGDHHSRLSGNLHFSLPGIPNSAMVARVRERLAISTGAACTSGIEAPSHVLRAIRLPDALQRSALRIGIGKFTTPDEIRVAANLLVSTARAIRATMVRTTFDDAPVLSARS